MRPLARVRLSSPCGSSPGRRTGFLGQAAAAAAAAAAADAVDAAAAATSPRRAVVGRAACAPQARSRSLALARALALARRPQAPRARAGRRRRATSRGRAQSRRQRGVQNPQRVWLARAERQGGGGAARRTGSARTHGPHGSWRRSTERVARLTSDPIVCDEEFYFCFAWLLRKLFSRRRARRLRGARAPSRSLRRGVGGRALWASPLVCRGARARVGASAAGGTASF